MLTIGRCAFQALGTGAVILVSDETRLAAATDAVYAELDAVDRACSRFREDSELEAVNRGAGTAVRASSVLLDYLEAALEAARFTGGDVDPTIGEALRILGYDDDFATVPRDGPPIVVVGKVAGWRQVRLDRLAGTVRIPPGVRLDLGATAKAMAADRAAARAARATGCGVLVSLGGDLATAGAAPCGGWTVLVTDDHRAAPDSAGEVVAITDGGLATSSTTVRTWSRGGESLHHVVDPATGRPAVVVWRTVSVATTSCLAANIAATAAIVRGEHALHWLASLGLAARLVRIDGTVEHVAGWPEPEDAP